MTDATGIAPAEDEDPFTPDPALVRALTAKVIDVAIDELHDTGAMDVGEIGDALLAHLDFDEQDVVIRAVLDLLRGVEVTYRIPGDDGREVCLTPEPFTHGTEPTQGV